MRKLSIAYFLFFLLLKQASAQDFVKHADKLYEANAFHEAAGMYLALLQQEYNYEYNVKLANCYRQMNQPLAAEYWYGELAEQPSATPKQILEYAQLLKLNGKYKSAKEWFLTYAKYDVNGYYLAGTCDWAFENQKKPSPYSLDTVSFNTSGSDIAPLFWNDRIIYASTGNIADVKNAKDLYATTGFPYYDFYYAEPANGSMTGRFPLPGKVNTKMHEASGCFNNYTKELFFTRNSYNNGRQKKGKDNIVKLDLYYAKYSDGAFKNVKEFPFDSKKYSVGQPTLSADGNVLIFASDMPGGFGGTDLYYSERTASGWGDPVNLGDIINSPGDEMFPFFSQENILYYSSNWLPGFGGLDIFSAERDGDHWTKPVNLGGPVNSSRDDFGFIKRNGKGFFSSNREGGKGGDDIYAFSEIHPIGFILVIDPDKNPVADANISFSSNGKRLRDFRTGADGMAEIPVFSGDNFTAVISKDGYLDANVKNIGTVKTNNGVYAVELQPLMGTQEQSPDQEHKQPDRDTTEIQNVNSGYSYEVQIGIYKNPDYSKLAQLANVGELDVKSKDDGSLQFTLTGFSTYEEAAAAKDAAVGKGFTDAFIITYKDGVRQN